MSWVCSKTKIDSGTKRPREEHYYPEVVGEGTPLNDKCLQQWLQESFCHNEMDETIPWNLLVGAIVRYRGTKDEWRAFCLRRHFAIVKTNAQRVAGAWQQCADLFVVAFDGPLSDTRTFTAYAWDPMDSHRLL